MGTVKDPELFAKKLEEKYGHSTAQNFLKILQCFPLNSVNRNVLINIKNCAALLGEEDLYDTIVRYLKIPAGSLEDDFSVSIPQKNNTKGDLEGLVEKGFKKELSKHGKTNMDEEFTLDNIHEFPQHHFTLDLIKDVMMNRNEILSAYVRSGKDLEKTLDFLISSNASWRKICDIEGRDSCLKHLREYLKK